MISEVLDMLWAETEKIELYFSLFNLHNEKSVFVVVNITKLYGQPVEVFIRYLSSKFTSWWKLYTQFIHRPQDLIAAIFPCLRIPSKKSVNHFKCRCFWIPNRRALNLFSIWNTVSCSVSTKSLIVTTFCESVLRF